jgi:hypothetical protein
VPYSVWKQPDHLVILADGVKAMSCNGEPEKVEDFTVQFQLYVINESTLALCEEPIYDARGDCMANPAAVLVEVPRTP